MIVNCLWEATQVWSPGGHMTAWLCFYSTYNLVSRRQTKVKEDSRSLYLQSLPMQKA